LADGSARASINLHHLYFRRDGLTRLEMPHTNQLADLVGDLTVDSPLVLIEVDRSDALHGTSVMPVGTSGDLNIRAYDVARSIARRTRFSDTG
jgi:hypothetical protein